MRLPTRRWVNPQRDALSLVVVLFYTTAICARRLAAGCWDPGFILNVGRPSTPGQVDGMHTGAPVSAAVVGPHSLPKTWVTPLYSTTPARRRHMFPWNSLDEVEETNNKPQVVTSFAWSPFKPSPPSTKASSTSKFPSFTLWPTAPSKTQGRGRSKAKDKKAATKPWFRLPGFDDFNKMWKDQLTLQNKIKKLEKEVSRDYRRTDRAKAAQYRYEVMQTLQGVRRQVAEIEEATRKLDRQDAKILRDNKETFRDTVVRPEDLDQLLKEEKSLLKMLTLDEQQWARMGSSMVGALIGLVVFPSHDFFGVIGAAALMTYLTTRGDWVGDGSRMLGYGTLAIFRQLSLLEKRFSVLNRMGTWLREALEAVIPFRLPWTEAPSWRNAYKGEGFLHPDLRPPPPLKDAQYVEYLREVKRWVDAEEQAVLASMKKKLDDRVQEEMDRAAMKEQATLLMKGFWETVTGKGDRGLRIELEREDDAAASRVVSLEEEGEEEDPEVGDGEMDLFYDDAAVTMGGRGRLVGDSVASRLGGGVDDMMPGGVMTESSMGLGLGATEPTGK